jgi:hypothetical protein
VAAVAVIAATLGVVVAMVVANRSPSAPPATSSPPSAAAPALGGGGAVTGGGGGGQGELFLGGKVVAVSPTSITLTGQGQQITAAITGSTKFTGVSGASGIKVGDMVTAQISGYGTSHAVATAIQDPPQMP